MHTMKVKTKYYQILKSGQKTIELRLFDEKRQKIKIGDKILFSDVSDSKENFKALVLNLYKAKNFDKLCDVISLQQAGFDTKEELINVLEEFYPISLQKEFGVVGIEIKKV